MTKTVELLQMVQLITHGSKLYVEEIHHLHYTERQSGLPQPKVTAKLTSKDSKPTFLILLVLVATILQLTPNVALIKKVPSNPQQRLRMVLISQLHRFLLRMNTHKPMLE